MTEKYILSIGHLSRQLNLSTGYMADLLGNNKCHMSTRKTNGDELSAEEAGVLYRALVKEHRRVEKYLKAALRQKTEEMLGN